MRGQLGNIAVMRFMSLMGKMKEENCTVLGGGGVVASPSAPG
jgi:hypothetical protein